MSVLTPARTSGRTANAQENFSAWANRHRKWLFAAPAMIFVGVLIIFPLAWTLYLSLTDSQGSVRAASEFIGLENYLTVLSDVERFWPAVGRTLSFTGVALAFEVVLGMGIALLLWRPFRGEKWVRVAILLPLVATPVAVGMMWRLIFDPNIGFVNQLLGMIGIPPQPWLSGQDTALGTTIFMDIWQWTPMVVLILLAGLTSLSEEPDEAARMDGANAFQRFFFITLPLMMPTVIVAILLRGIDALKTFDILYATKGKGGGSFHEVETLNVYAYGLSFDYNQYGLSSAVLILFFMILIGTTAAAAPAPRRRKPLATRAYKVFRVVALIAVVLFLIAPLIWMLLASFKTNVDIYDTATSFVFTPTGENYANVLQRNNYFVFIFNSFWVAFVSTALSLVLGVPAAYAMSRFTMHRSALVVLMARVIPGVSLLVPWYYVFSNLKMVGGFEVLILSHMFVALPLIVYIMMSYFDSLPLELEESAQVDGLTPIGAFRRITLPLSVSGIATAGILSFIFSWNNFMFALVLSGSKTKTLPVAIFDFVSYASIDWGGLMAAATVVTIPIMIIALFTQKYIVSGLTAGATKG